MVDKLPYGCPSYLLPDERKIKKLGKSYNHFMSGAEDFFNLFISLMGGVNPDMDFVSKNKSSEIKSNRNPQVICATLWFRPMEAHRATTVLSPEQMKKQFDKYYKKYETSMERNPMVDIYFDSPISEDYAWVDCRALYENLVKELAKKANISQQKMRKNLENDIDCLFHPNEKKILPFGSNESWGVNSTLFGEGEKEDRGKKRRILSATIQTLTETPPTSSADVQKALLEAANIDDPALFFTHKVWGSGGNPSKVARMARGDYIGKKFDCEKVMKDINDELEVKKRDFKLKANQTIKEYMIEKIGHYNPNSWSEMINNSIVTIVSKNTRNVNLAKEKLDLHKALEKTSGEKVDLLNEFFSSDYFLTNEVFDIMPHNLGGKGGLKSFYKFCNDNADKYETDEALVDAAIENLISTLKNKGLKEPHKDILRYVFSIREEVSYQDLEDAAQCIQTRKQIENKKVNPTIKSDSGFSFSASANSNLIGEIVPPDTIVNGKVAGQSGFIWIKIKLWEGGDRWVEHHIPFTDTRFYEQVYKYNPDSELDKVSLRTKQYDVDLTKFNLSSEETDLTHAFPEGKSHNYVKVHRRQQRLNHPDVPNVDWPKDGIGFTIQKKKVDGKIRYKISVTHKLPKPKAKKPKFTVGDILIGVDQNQTTNNTCSIWEVVKKGTPGALLIPNSKIYVKLLETKRVTSYTKNRNDLEATDQLHYGGISKDTTRFKNWFKERKAFIASLGAKEFINEFESIVAKRDQLYPFNNSYLKLLKKVVSGKFGKKKIDVMGEHQEAIREEILTMCSKNGLGPLRLSSLSSDSLQSIGALKSIIYSYLAYLLNKQDKKKKITDIRRKKADSELFGYLNKIENKRVNKREEKSRRNANYILNLTLEYQKQTQGAVTLFCEGIDSKPTGNSKKTNASNLDWDARRLFKFLKQGAERHGIYFSKVSPQYTSHQDPFEYHPKDKKMLPRLAKFDRNYPIPDWAKKKYLGFAKSNPEKGTAIYYKEGIENFVSHYRKVIEQSTGYANAELDEMQNLLNSLLEDGKLDQVFCPMRGGRYYLATHPVTSDAQEFIFNGKKCYICDSDEVAATNVMLIGVFNMI